MSSTKIMLMATNMEEAKHESETHGMTGDGGGNRNGGNAVSEDVILKKGPWTAAEDAILIEYVTKHGEGNWNAVQKNTGLARCGKSCRLRWANHLRPNLKKGAFSPEEEKLILELHAQFGNKWARMATLLPGRTDNEIKNYWNTRVKRRQRQGLPLYSDEPDRSTTSPKPIIALAPPIATQFEFLHRHYHHPLSSPTLPPHSPLSSPVQPKSAISDPMIPLSSPSSSSTSIHSFTFNRPAPLLYNPLGFKRFRTSSSYPLQVAPSAITASALFSDKPVTMPQSTRHAGFGSPGQVNSSFSQIYQAPLLESDQEGVLSQFTNFSVKPQLPSNHFSQPNIMGPEYNFDKQMNNPIALKTSGGNRFLGDNPFDAQALASGQTALKKQSFLCPNEGNNTFDGHEVFDDLPLNSSYWSSNAG